MTITNTVNSSISSTAETAPMPVGIRAAAQAESVRGQGSSRPSDSGVARWRQLLADDTGLSTIEYAMGTLAAAALAAVLYLIVNSSAVSDALEGIIMDALSKTPS